MPLGMSFGIGIGFITGIIALIIFLIMSANMKVGSQTGQIIKDPKIISLLFSIPTIWALGFVGNGAILRFVDFAEIIGTYFTYLISTFILMVLYPVVILILQVARKLKELGSL